MQRLSPVTEGTLPESFLSDLRQRCGIGIRIERNAIQFVGFPVALPNGQGNRPDVSHLLERRGDERRETFPNGLANNANPRTKRDRLLQELVPFRKSGPDFRIAMIEPQITADLFPVPSEGEDLFRSRLRDPAYRRIANAGGESLNPVSSMRIPVKDLTGIQSLFQIKWPARRQRD